MDSQWLFVMKLLVLSTILAVAIKYLVPLLQIPATPEIALALVLSPTIILAGILAWRRWQFEKKFEKDKL
ncbi:hypothetical protein HJG54_05900 [Leptolyngbya sp. NK1-12]|uniref:Uncharacterized protein n=1 Tax=Leptolyngbya sp. NK1-12 TaxID=2547451 RepID=A0AA97AH62_9CYAN|nr:hypothetical protein [Leptolyngbya sp. NK1-12]WNZ22441.1 hypothetical protein HJG54_05900 [Leptolyngbya sp. NK1-12]